MIIWFYFWKFWTTDSSRTKGSILAGSCTPAEWQPSLRAARNPALDVVWWRHCLQWLGRVSTESAVSQVSQGRPKESGSDRPGRWRRPGDPPTHNRSPIVATASPGAGQEKGGGGGEVGGLSFTTCARNISHTTCYPRHHFPSHLKSHLLLPLNVGNGKSELSLPSRWRYALLPVKRLALCFFDYLGK